MLSNLLWWPWFGFTREAPPVTGEQNPMGDRRVHNEVVRRHPIDEDDEEFEMIAWVLARL